MDSFDHADDVLVHNDFLGCGYLPIDWHGSNSQAIFGVAQNQWHAPSTFTSNASGSTDDFSTNQLDDYVERSPSSA
jgi:hypothetical protein